jgi:hypothetical protein
MMVAIEFAKNLGREQIKTAKHLRSMSETLTELVDVIPDASKLHYKRSGIMSMAQ